MADVTIKVRHNGPFLVSGSFEIVDVNGKAFAVNPDKPNVALCRCGQSANRPFCDGAHNQCEFQSEETAGE